MIQDPDDLARGALQTDLLVRADRSLANHRGNRWRLVCGALLLSAAGACGGGSAQKAGGHCLAPWACWQVTDPPNYSIQLECAALSGGMWSPGDCDPSGYAQMCTEEFQVSMNGGPKMNVQYVYYFPPNSTFSCLGPLVPIDGGADAGGAEDGSGEGHHAD